MSPLLILLALPAGAQETPAPAPAPAAPAPDSSAKRPEPAPAAPAPAPADAPAKDGAANPWAGVTTEPPAPAPADEDDEDDDDDDDDDDDEGEDEDEEDDDEDDDDDDDVVSRTPGYPTRPDAEDPKVEISLELGSLHNGDAAWDLFNDGDGMPSWGVRGGYRLNERVAVIGSWNYVRRGAQVEVGGSTTDSTDADFTSGGSSFVAAMYAHQVSAGLKADVDLLDVIFPYVTAQASVFGASMRFDDDPSDRNNPGQITGGGVTGGFLLAPGVELRLPPDAPVSVAWYLEPGYHWLARMDTGDFGSMKAHGFAIHSGIGVRF